MESQPSKGAGRRGSQPSRRDAKPGRATTRGSESSASDRRRSSETSSRPSGGRKAGPRRRGGAFEEIERLADQRRAPRLVGRVGDATKAFSEERYGDARRILAPIVTEVPDAAIARELYGLTLYRLGRWADAVRELEAFNSLAPGSCEQHPVLADANRALGRHGRVQELWDELKEASPNPWLVAEGRIVMAGSLADQGHLDDAIGVLRSNWRIPRRPRPDHLRRAYALADLLERAGDVPAARRLFEWIVEVDPVFADAPERLAATRRS